MEWKAETRQRSYKKSASYPICCLAQQNTMRKRDTEIPNQSEYELQVAKGYKTLRTERNS